MPRFLEKEVEIAALAKRLWRGLLANNPNISEATGSPDTDKNKKYDVNRVSEQFYRSTGCSRKSNHSQNGGIGRAC